jgi:O-antigen/teichoic acid export membrane protein
MSSKSLPSIRERFLASFINNIVRSGISFLSAILLARWLGPEDFGRLSFILASLLAFKQLLDVGTASAFLTLTSQRTRSKKFIKSYWIWILFQFIISILLVSFIIPDVEVSLLWNGEKRSLIILGIFAVFAQNSIWTTSLALADSQRKTIPAQKINTLVVLIHLIVLIMLWTFGKLAIPFLFVALSIEWSLAAWLSRKLYILNTEIDEGENFYSIFSEFKVFCLPLIPYFWLAFIHDFSERWMLQYWGGSAEQAYFSIAKQFSIITLLVATSILSIFWKEISEAHYQDNNEKVRTLFTKAHRMLYLFGVIVSCFIFPWSKEILLFTVGREYIAGEITFMLMIFYPVYQILGQIGGVMLLATHKTRLSTLIGGGAMILGLVVSYFMLAPQDAYISGFGLASKGLAWKMLIVQFIQVNVLFWFISKLFGVKNEWKFQIIALIIGISLSWALKVLVVQWLSFSILLSIFFYCLIYFILSALMLYFFPSIIGLGRNEIKGFISSIFKILK